MSNIGTWRTPSALEFKASRDGAPRHSLNAQSWNGDELPAAGRSFQAVSCETLKRISEKFRIKIINVRNVKNHHSARECQT